MSADTEEMQAGYCPVERLIRLEPRSITNPAIPWHPAFDRIEDFKKDTYPARPSLDHFIKEAIRQALHFTSRVSPSGDDQSEDKKEYRWKSKCVKKIEGVKVNVYRRKIMANEFHLPITGTNSASSDQAHVESKAKEISEYWFARESLHQNVAGVGSASYEEFYRGLKVSHADNEVEITPNIKWANRVLDWENASNVGFRGEAWTRIRMSAYEMCHDFGPIQKRIFPILLIQAQISLREFIVISLPVTDTHLLPGSLIPKTRGTIGNYVAIERVNLLDTDDKIKWVMCTACNVGGWIPMTVQLPKTPKMIAKDVGYFLKWNEKERKRLADNQLNKDDKLLPSSSGDNGDVGESKDIVTQKKQNDDTTTN